MALATTIATDAVAGTIVGTVTLLPSTAIETITYTNSTSQISLVTELASTLSPTDFLALLQFYIAFNNVIIAGVFSPSQFQYIPFTPSLDCNLLNDGVSALSWSIAQNPAPSAGATVFKSTATYPAGTVAVGRRANAVTLSYAQWLWVLYNMAYYQLMIHSIYKI